MNIYKCSFTDLDWNNISISVFATTEEKAFKFLQGLDNCLAVNSIK